MIVYKQRESGGWNLPRDIEPESRTDAHTPAAARANRARPIATANRPATLSEGVRPPTGPIRPEDGQPGRQVLEMEPIGTGAGTVMGGLMIRTCALVTTKGSTGPRTTVKVGSDELPAGGVLDDAAPALAVLEAATAAGAWTRAARTSWWAALWTSARAIGRSSPAWGLTTEGTSRASSGSS